MSERPQSKGWSPLKIILFTIPLLGFWLLALACFYVFKGEPIHEHRDLTFTEFSTIVSEERLAPWPDGSTSVHLNLEEGKPAGPADILGIFYSGASGDSPKYYFTARISTPEEMDAFRALAERQKLEVSTRTIELIPPR